MERSLPDGENTGDKSSAKEWFYAVGEERYGPVSEPVLIEKAKTGQVDRKTKLWKEGLPKWILLENTPFLEFLPKVQPPPLDQLNDDVPVSFNVTTRSSAHRPAPDLSPAPPAPERHDIKKFKIYVNPAGLSEAVKQGFSWPAFFFTFIWAFVKRMNDIGGFVLGGWLFLIMLYAGIVSGAQPSTQGVLSGLFSLVETGLVVVFGVNGNRWREQNLIKRGYRFQGVITAETDEAALAEYVRCHKTSAAK